MQNSTMVSVLMPSIVTDEIEMVTRHMAIASQAVANTGIKDSEAQRPPTDVEDVGERRPAAGAIGLLLVEGVEGSVRQESACEQGA